MEKCVFIGYPQGYKGWKFYNPVTKKVIISERADFDERFFMLQKHSVPQLPPPRPESLIDPPPAISLLVGYAICHMIWTPLVPQVDMSQKPTPMNQGQIAQWLEHLVYIQKVLGSIPSLAISLSPPVCHLYIRACSVLCSLSLSPCVRSLWCFPNRGTSVRRNPHMPCHSSLSRRKMESYDRSKII